MTKKAIGAAAVGILLLASGVSAQTTGTGTDATSTVGTPNTGAGGQTGANLIVLAGSAALALGGAAYLARRRAI